MKQKITIIAILSLILFSSAFAQPLKPGYDIKVLNTTSTSTILEYNVTGYDQKDVVINGGRYVHYEIPGMISLMENGFPQLPSIRNSIVIPDLAGMNYRILEQQFSTIESIPVMPSKGHFTRNIDPETVPYEFSNIYRTDTWYPENNIELDVPYIVKDLRGLTVRFNPMQYNAVQGKLKICSRIVIEVFDDKSVQAVNPFYRNRPLRGVSKDFDDVYKTLFENYGLGVHNYVPIPEPGRLLIVYPTVFANQITPFYNWKIEKGTPTLLAEYPTQTGTGAAALKTYIQNLYNSAEGLTYIILVGEANQIPYLSGVYEGAPSDPCYVKLAGSDAYPDAYISRISPTNATNLAYIFWKIIKYEKYPDTGVNGAWYTKGIGVASSEGSPPDWKYADTLRALLMNRMYFTQVDQIYDPGATSSSVTTAINNGRSIINYIGHGSGTSWSTTGYSNTQINALSNGYKNPFIFDVACLNGNFTMGECMEEAWLRAGDSLNAKGAVAAFGSTTNASWVPPLDMQRHAMDLLTLRQRQTVGGVCINGLMKGMDLWGGSTGEGLKMMEQYHIFGDCTTMLTFGLIPDSVAPATITNLAVADPTSNGLKVTWTSPIDSSLGGVTAYDLRYSTSQITNENFTSAASIMIPGLPDSAGITKTYTFSNLNFNTVYYFAVKSKDMWGNISELSNVPSQSTLAAPQLAVNMDSLHCLMLPNTAETDTIIISNVSPGASTLDFSIDLTNQVFPVKAVLRNINTEDKDKTFSKSNPDENRGTGIRGHGGPDAFGYEWIDSNEPGGPAYVWNDIVSTGTLVTNWVATSTYTALDEGKAGPFQFGFSFKFYGVQYNQIWLSSNGWLSFTDITDAAMTNGTIPATTAPNGIISPLWDDLDGKTTGKVYYKQEATRFIIQYDNWPGYSSTTGPFTFQVVLFKSGKIMIYYKSVAGATNSATVGIENQTGTIGLQVIKNAAYLVNNLALQFSAEPDWLLPNTVSGRIYNGNSIAVCLDISTEGLELGNYSMDVVISSNDPLNSSCAIPVSLVVSNDVPVEMVGLTARNSNDEIIIEWITKTETNNKGFEIERKEGNSWKKISFIQGKGTTTEPVNYSITDKVSRTGKYIYRIKQYDLDGTINMNQEVEVEVAGPDKYALDQNYPNPFNPATTIKYALPEASRIRITIFNLLGEIVSILTDEVKEAGYYTENWNASNLPSGVYILSIDAKSVSGNTEYQGIKKMSLIK
jgi:hypothetical protein